MTDELQQILCDLIERHGRELVREPKRLEGMLNDACAGQHRGARRVLVDAVQERVVEELLAFGPSEQLEVVVRRAQQRLIENLAIAPDAALWAIQAWSAALQVGRSTVPPPAKDPTDVVRTEFSTRTVNRFGQVAGSVDFKGDGNRVVVAGKNADLVSALVGFIQIAWDKVPDNDRLTFVRHMLLAEDGSSARHRETFSHAMLHYFLELKSNQIRVPEAIAKIIMLLPEVSPPPLSRPLSDAIRRILLSVYERGPRG